MRKIKDNRTKEEIEEDERWASLTENKQIDELKTIANKILDNNMLTIK